MEWVKGLQKAIDYIEDHITEDIDYAEIAKQAYSSSFHFQRVFHIICGYSIGEYIRPSEKRKTYTQIFFQSFRKNHIRRRNNNGLQN